MLLLLRVVEVEEVVMAVAVVGVEAVVVVGRVVDALEVVEDKELVEEAAVFRDVRDMTVDKVVDCGLAAPVDACVLEEVANVVVNATGDELDVPIVDADVEVVDEVILALMTD